MGLLPDKQILNWKSSSNNIFCMQSVLGVSVLVWESEKPNVSFRFPFLPIKKREKNGAIKKLEYEKAHNPLVIFVELLKFL